MKITKTAKVLFKIRAGVQVLNVFVAIFAIAYCLSVFVAGCGDEAPKNQEPVWIGAVGHGSVDSSNDHWIGAVGHGTTDSRINLDVIRQVTADMWLVLDTTALINRIRKQVLDSLNVAPLKTVLYVTERCLYSTEYEVCEVREHKFLPDTLLLNYFNGDVYQRAFYCKWCGGKYRNENKLIEISPPTK